MKATNEQLIESYGRLNNVWLVAKEFGMCGQSVQERLVRLGVERSTRYFSDAEKDVLRKEYQNYAGRGILEELAKRLGRDKTTICGMAKKLGLTCQKRKRMGFDSHEANAEATRRYIASRPHPRGFLGKTHPQSARDRISESSKLMNKRINESGRRGSVTLKQQQTKMAKYGCIVPERQKATWKQGWREIGGIRKYYRSKWEANYARYLEFLKVHGEILSWQHEPETFWFEGVKRGCVSYLPDFKVINKNGSIEYHEVKGWYDDRSLTKIKRMAEFYPDVKLVLIDAKWFKANNRKLSGLIKDWE